MGIKIDEQTQIVYENHIIDAEAVAKDYAKWEGAKKVSFDDFLSTGPKDLLVLRDIFDAPLEIVRDPKYGDLVLQADVAKREGKKRKFDRPYTAIALTPTEGQVAAVRHLQDVCGGMSFRLKETTNDHIAFDGIKNKDLEMIVNYKPR